MENLVVKNVKNLAFVNEKGSSKFNGFVIYNKSNDTYMAIGYKDSKGITLPFNFLSKISAKESLTDGILETKNICWIKTGQYNL